MPECRPIDLARIAYDAYGASTGWRTHDGRDMPRFEDLGGGVTAAWVAAVTAVKQALTPEFQSSVTDVPARPGRAETQGGSQ